MLFGSSELDDGTPSNVSLVFGLWSPSGLGTYGQVLIPFYGTLFLTESAAVGNGEGILDKEATSHDVEDITEASHFISINCIKNCFFW
jgi:hypothetical protein